MIIKEIEEIESSQDQDGKVENNLSALNLLSPLDTFPALNCFRPHKPLHGCVPIEQDATFHLINFKWISTKISKIDLRLPMGGFAYGIPVKAR